MKKLLMIILIILLGTAVYMAMFKNIEIGSWKSTNFQELQALDQKLKNDIEEAKTLNERDYKNQIGMLTASIKVLNKTKEAYENKIKYLNEEVELGTVSIKEYKIEYLWTILENYAKDEKILLKLDLIENGGQDNLYNLNITLKGSYIGITDFIYDIEKDDTFDFKVEDFKIVPGVVKTVTNNGSQTVKVPQNDKVMPGNSTSNNSSTDNTTQTTGGDTNSLEATFTIRNVRIELN